MPERCMTAEERVLKVVIADDEQRVCQLVQLLADWEALGMEVVATAANGLEALERIRQFAPDILITDIRMPGCNGLDLIRQAKDISPQVEIIIISGYAQFEYARIALQFGVGDYLLKPIKKDALMGALQKLGKRCRARAVSDAVVETLHRDSQESAQLLRERFAVDLLQKQLTAPSREQLLSEYHIEVKNGLVQVYLLKMDYDPERFSEASVEIVRQKAKEIFSRGTGQLCHISILQFNDGVGCGVVNYAPEVRERLRGVLRDALKQLEAQKFFFGSVKFSLALGKAVERVEQLPDSLEQATSALAERLVEGTGRMLEAVLPPSSLRTQPILDKYRRAAAEAVESVDPARADTAADALEDAAKQAPDIRGRELLELVLAAGKIFMILVNAKEEETLLAKFRRRCDQCSKMSELFACLREMQRSQLEQISQREDEAIRPIRIAKQYIQQHCGQPITLEDVCAATGFSISYFSTMFKKETGEGFNKYLIRIRVERAKALLQETNLPVAQICQEVGYSDLKHFSTTFKKATGLNPGQYRKLFG